MNIDNQNQIPFSDMTIDEIRAEMGSLLGIEPKVGIEDEYEHAIPYQMDDWAVNRFQELRTKLNDIKNGSLREPVRNNESDVMDRVNAIRKEMGELLGIEPYVGIENENEHAIPYQMDDWAIDKFQELREELKGIAKEHPEIFANIDRINAIRKEMGELLGIEPYAGIENEYEHKVPYQMDDWAVNRFQELREELKGLLKGNSVDPSVEAVVAPVEPVTTVDNSKYDKFEVEVVYDENKDVYKVYCQCGDIGLQKYAPEIAAADISSEAIQEVVDKFIEKVALNTSLTLDQLKAKRVDCKLDNRFIDRVDEKSVGEAINKQIDKNIEVKVDLSGNNSLGSGNNSGTGNQEDEGLGSQGDEGLEDNLTSGNNSGSGDNSGLGSQRDEDLGDDLTSGNNLGDQGNGTSDEDLDEDLGQLPPQNGMTENLKEVMKGAKRVISSHRMIARKISISCFIVALAAAGLGFSIPTLSIAGAAKFVGLVAALGGGIVELASSIPDFVAWAQYKATTFKLNSIARKVTKEFNKHNKRSGIKFKVRAVPKTGELRFAIVKDKKDYGFIDSRSTGVIIGDGYSLDQREIQDVVSSFQKKLDKSFKDYNDPINRGAYQEKYNIPKVTVDNMPVLFAKFGGYHFNLEGDQFGMMDVAKVSEEEKKGNGLGKFFSKFRFGKKKKKIVGDSLEQEEALEDIVSRNVEASTGGVLNSENYGADVNEEEVLSALGDGLNQEIIEEDMNQQDFPLEQNGVDPNANANADLLDELNQPDDINAQEAASVDVFVSQIVSDEVERQAFVSDIMNLTEEERNALYRSFSEMTINNAEELRTAINNVQGISQDMSNNL